MRNLIKIVEGETPSTWIGNDEHPHRTGQDEWYNHGFGLFQTNVDALKRKLAAGEIVPQHMHAYPVSEIVPKLFPSFDPDGVRFGSKDFSEESSIDLFGPPVTMSRMANIPADKMEETIVFIMWDSDDALVTIGMPKPKTPIGRPVPTMIDGNHRLIRRYLEGDTGTVQCVFVSYEDACKVTMNRGTLMSEYKAQKAKRKPKPKA